MTYRADEVGLSLRIEQLEKDVAELEGTRAGLRVALAELIERARDAQAKWKKAVRATRRMMIAGAGLFVGFLGGSMVSGSGIMAGMIACDSLGGGLEETSLTGTMLGESSSPASCTITVEGDAGDPAVDSDDEGCRAEIRCGDEVIYRGRGGCGQYFDADLLEYWDHATTSEDGSPAIVIAETEMFATLRDDDGTVVTLRLAKVPGE